MSVTEFHVKVTKSWNRMEKGRQEIYSNSCNQTWNKWTGSKLKKEYIKAVYCHPIYLTYMQSAAAAAESLQSCPTLCEPRNGSLPGSPVSGILQAGTLEWVVISFSNAWKWKVKVKPLSHVWPLATPWTAAYQAPPSMGCHCLLHICRLHHEKYQAWWSTSWKQDCWEK